VSPTAFNGFAQGEAERTLDMQQQISVITLSVGDLARSKRFYVEGFGWRPVFENEEIVFYQMNGLMLGTWLDGGLESTCSGTALRALEPSAWRTM
jgi:catechol 2,3-dioxygenase-like lactoylglutathione lyase family enzyme